MGIKKGRTESGFDFEVKTEDLNDMYFVEALAEAKDDFLAIPKVLKMLLGDEQKKALYKHLEDENGRVSMESIDEEITSILLNSGEESKN